MQTRDILVDLRKIGIDQTFTFSLHPSDEGLSIDLERNGFREPLNSYFYYKSIEPSDVVLDIGANLGYFTMLSHKAKRIICVEPLEEGIEIVRQNARLNGIEEKCEFVNCAVGPQDGEVFFNVSAKLNLSSVSKDGSGRRVQMRALSNICPEYGANVLRMDVQGYEYDILMNNTPDHVTKISIEIHPQIMGDERTAELLRYLGSIGFRARYFIDDLPNRIYEYHGLLRATGLKRLFCGVRENISMEEVAATYQRRLSPVGKLYAYLNPKFRRRVFYLLCER
jgi:FkbM family methyltransferase